MASMRKNLEIALSGELSQENADLVVSIVVDALKQGITSCCITIDQDGWRKCDMTPQSLPKVLFESRCSICKKEITAKLREVGKWT